MRARRRQRFVFERSYEACGGKCLVWRRVDVEDGSEFRALVDDFWSGRGPIHWYPGYQGGLISRVRAAVGVTGEATK